MDAYAKTKAAMCCATSKKRRTDALRACDYCTNSMSERSVCYKAVAKDEGLRYKTCLMMQ